MHLVIPGITTFFEEKRGIEPPPSVIDNFWVFAIQEWVCSWILFLPEKHLRMVLLVFLSDLFMIQELLVIWESRSHMHVRVFRKPVNSLVCFCWTKAVSAWTKDFAQ